MVKKNLFKIALIASAIVTVVTTPVKADEERKGWHRELSKSDNTRNFIEGVDRASFTKYNLYEGYEVASIDEYNNGEEWNSSPEECSTHYFTVDKSYDIIKEWCYNAILVDGQDPTCTEDGETPLVICKECGIIVNEGGEKMPKLGHKEYEMNNYVMPTCSKEGHENDIGCSRCGKVIIKGETIKKQKHDYWGVEPVILKGETVKSTGTKQYTCRNCGHKEIVVIPKLKLSKPVIKLSTTSTGIKMNWNSAGAKGYEVQVSKNKNMSSCDTYNTSSKLKELYDLGSYTNYYVRARAYKLNSKNQKVYTDWTSPSRIKTKKAKIENSVITELYQYSKFLEVYFKTPQSFGTKFSTYNTKGVLSGFQVRYSTSRNMRNAKVISTLAISQCGVHLLDLKSSTTYYIQIRRFVATDGKGYQWSNWSKTVKAKTLPAQNQSTCNHGGNSIFWGKVWYYTTNVDKMKVKKSLKGGLKVLSVGNAINETEICRSCGKKFRVEKLKAWNENKIIFDNRNITDYHKAATSLADYMISHHYKGINKKSYTKKDKADLVYCIEKVLKGDGNSYKNDELSYKKGNVQIMADNFVLNRSISSIDNFYD